MRQQADNLSVGSIRSEVAWAWLIPASLLMLGAAYDAKAAIAVVIGAVAALSLSGSI
jgi:hypothetical protein